MASSRTYLHGFFAALLVGSSLISAFNYVVDPYQLFSFISIAKFNEKKPMNRRLFMPIDATRAPSDFAVLGSSRAGAIYKTLRAAKPHDRLVDAHLSALRSREAAEFLRLFASRNEIKRIIYGADFFGFNINSPYHAAFIPGIVGEGRLWRLKMMALFGISATQGSFKTIWANIHPGPQVKKANDEEDENSESSDQLRNQFRYQLMMYQSNPRFYKGFKLDTGAIEQVAEALRVVKASGKNIHILIGPSHALLWEAVHKSGNWPAFEHWKRALGQIAQSIGIPIWDFASFSHISTVRVNHALPWYRDASHFSPEVAGMVLRCMFEQKDCEPLDGAKLEPSTIESRLQSIRVKRAKWLAGEDILQELKLLDYSTVQ